jgi:hypothetical protein
VEQEIRLLVYVNDLVATALKHSNLDWFYTQLYTRFNAKDLGDIKKILRVRITRNQEQGTIELDQEQYLEKVLNKFGFLNLVQSEPTLIDRYYNL